MNQKIKYCLLLVALFCSGNIEAQEEYPDKLIAKNDSLTQFCDTSKLVKEISFILKSFRGAKLVSRAEYNCRVYKNRILKISCESRTLIGKTGSISMNWVRQTVYYNYQVPIFVGQADNGRYYNDNVKWEEASIDDELNCNPWEASLNYYRGKLIWYFSNGHGISETDEWNPSTWGMEIAYKLRKAVQTKYPNLK